MSVKITRVFKIIARIIFFFLGYVCLPIYITVHRPHPLPRLLLFYSANLVILLILLNRNYQRTRNIELQEEDLQEKNNLLQEESAKDNKNILALKEKIRRYDRLKYIIEEINQSLDLESIAENLVSLAFALLANNKGVCILYLVDNQTQKLGIFKTKKEDRHLFIKTKEGDIFDHWVLRHVSPLVIEDIRNDFRFDLEKIKNQETRIISSLISAPLISEHRFLGVLRLDNSTAAFFSQDDLRFLVTLCDLGAVAIENAQLFQKTQEVAIHDELTSLYTKGYFIERLKQEYKRALRGQRPLSLLMIDIDYFKNYNDKFGHTAGDLVLRTLSQNLIEVLKDYDPIISRFGGEEFCIILPNKDKKAAFTIAQELRERIAKEKIVLRRLENNVTVSVGLAAFPQDAADENELILKADRAMYEAKQRGRNRVCSI